MRGGDGELIMITLSFPLGGRGEGGRGEGGWTDVRWEVTRLNAGDFKTYASILLKKIERRFSFQRKTTLDIFTKKLIGLSIKQVKNKHVGQHLIRKSASVFSVFLRNANLTE